MRLVKFIVLGSFCLGSLQAIPIQQPRQLTPAEEVEKMTIHYFYLFRRSQEMRKEGLDLREKIKAITMKNSEANDVFCRLCMEEEYGYVDWAVHSQDVN